MRARPCNTWISMDQWTQPSLTSGTNALLRCQHPDGPAQPICKLSWRDVTTKGCSVRLQRWQHALILVIGMWLISSPYLFPSYDAGGAAPVWTSHLVGAALFVLAAVSLLKPRRWLDWTGLAIGCWLIVAPLVLDFSSMTGIAMSNHMIAGIRLQATS